MSKRKHYRHTKRFETVFTSGGITQRGITSDVSEGGLFIRTRYGLTPGSIVDLEIHLNDGMVSKMRGRVKRSIRTAITALKNGMGVELLDIDSNYRNLLTEIAGERDGNGGKAPKTDAAQAHQLPEYLIIACSGCGAKNKVPRAKLVLGPKCGKCGTILRETDIA